MESRVVYSSILVRLFAVLLYDMLGPRHALHASTCIPCSIVLFLRRSWSRYLVHFLDALGIRGIFQLRAEVLHLFGRVAQDGLNLRLILLCKVVHVHVAVLVLVVQMVDNL